MPPIFINGGIYNSNTHISWKYFERMGKLARRHEPLHAGVLIVGGGGCYFLFDTSDLQMLLIWHDFPVFFLILFYTFVGKLEIPKFTAGRKICLFRSLHVRACRTAGLGGSSPPHFLKKYVTEKKKEWEREKNKWPPNVTNEVSKYAHLTVIKCLKPQSLRGLRPLDPTKCPEAVPWMLIWP